MHFIKINRTFKLNSKNSMMNSRISKSIKISILSTLLALSANNVFAQQDDIEKEILRYKTMQKAKPTNASVNYRLGTLYYSIKDYDLAMKHLTIATEQSDEEYGAMDLLAWAYFKTGQLDAAKALFEKILIAKPGNYSATKGLEKIKKS